MKRKAASDFGNEVSGLHKGPKALQNSKKESKETNTMVEPLSPKLVRISKTTNRVVPEPASHEGTRSPSRFAAFTAGRAWGRLWAASAMAAPRIFTSSMPRGTDAGPDADGSGQSIPMLVGTSTEKGG